MKRHVIIILCTCVLIQGACGGGGDEVESLDALGQKLEDAGIPCEGLADESDELFVREGGSCESELGRLAVYVFNDSENRDTYLEAARGFGGGPYVIGSNWVIEAPSASKADEIASKLDADVE